MKITPLNKIHRELGAKLIDFGGWEMPVQYEGVIAEHNAVRNSVGIFDVSHMGEIKLEGHTALETVQNLVTNDLYNALPGRAVYSPMCCENGGTVDDLLVYPLSGKEYLLVVNAANTEKDWEWINEHVMHGTVTSNISDETAQVAVQGPKSVATLNKIARFDVDTLGYYHFATDAVIGDNIHVIISRTGYTGEDGFEIYASTQDVVKLWEMIIEAGKEFDIKPIGLGARDTLRFEACLPLYGHELSSEISPVEAGLERFIKPGKKHFIGKTALKRQIEHGTTRRLVGFEMEQRGVARHGYPIANGNDTIGFVTSGSYSPTLDKNLGLGLVQTEFSGEGQPVQVLIREKPVNARVVHKPFYSRKHHKKY